MKALFAGIREKLGRCDMASLWAPTTSSVNFLNTAVSQGVSHETPAKTSAKTPAKTPAKTV